MPPKSDAQLLREYAEQANEAAFREIVLRYTDLVYSAALRQVESPDLARDVAQNVFSDLARKARSVAGGFSETASLVGWLYRGTRFEALNLRRQELRRHSREIKAMESTILSSEPALDWERLRPVVDEAMAELNEVDREALLLRFFKDQDLRQVGEALGISDDAAQKRVSRALDRLRDNLSRRGVVAATGALAAALTAHAVQAAPAGLGAAISAAVLAGSTTTATLTATAAKAIAMTAIQKTLVTATLTVAVGTGIYEAHRAAQLRNQIRTVQQELAARTRQSRQWQRQHDQLASQLGALQDENTRLRSETAELAKLRGEVDRLRHKEKTGAIARASTQPGNSTPASNLEVPEATWADAGFATPRDALRTRGWAVLNGNRKRFQDSLFVTTAARKALEDRIIQMARASTDPNKAQYIQEAINNKYDVADAILMPMMALNRDKEFTGYRILSEQSPSPDERILEVETQVVQGPSKEETLKLRRIGGDWKVVIDEDFVRSNLN